MTQPSAFQKKFLRQPEWLAAILITAVITWLHLFFWMHAGGFWRDEVNLLNLSSRHSMSDMAKDSFPVLMPLMVKGWGKIGLGGSDSHLRLLGILTGLGIPAALWLMAWTSKRSPPLLSLTLFGLNSTAIYYGDSLRSYGLGSLLIVLAAAAMLKFLKSPTWPRAAVLAAVAVLNVQALYQNAVLFAAICFGAWMVCGWRKDFHAAGKILAAALVAAISLLPYRTVIPQLLEATSSRRAGFLPKMSWDNFHTITAFPVPLYTCVWGLLVVFVLVSTCKTLLAKISISKIVMPDNHITTADLRVFAGATLLATFTGFIGFLWFNGLRTQTWYLLPPLALVAVCFDLGVPIPPARYFRATVYGFIAATVLIAVPIALRDLSYRFTNVDVLAKKLTQEASPQDFIIVTPWYLGISFEYYFKGATSWDTLPPLNDHSIHRYDLADEAMQNPKVFQPVLNKIAATLQGGHQVWIVGWMYVPSSGRPPPNLVGRFIWEHSLQFAPVPVDVGSRVYDYEDLQLQSADGWKNPSSSGQFQTLNTNRFQ